MYFEVIMQISIVTFKVLSDHVMVLKDIDFYYCKESETMEPFDIRLDREDTETTRSWQFATLASQMEPSSFA